MEIIYCLILIACCIGSFLVGYSHGYKDAGIEMLSNMTEKVLKKRKENASKIIENAMKK